MGVWARLSSDPSLAVPFPFLKAKQTMRTRKITLEDYRGSRAEFEMLEAERILQRGRKVRYTDEPVWRIPEDSEYEFTRNGIRKKSNTGEAEAEA